MLPLRQSCLVNPDRLPTQWFGAAEAAKFHTAAVNDFTPPLPVTEQKLGCIVPSSSDCFSSLSTFSINCATVLSQTAPFRELRDDGFPERCFSTRLRRCDAGT